MLRRLLPLLLISTLALAGCSEKTSDQTPATTSAPSAQPTGADFKVALLTSGPVTDGGWNQSAWAGVQKIQTDMGATVAKQESLKPNAFEEAFRDFANRGFNMVIGHGDEYTDAAAKVAAQFPNVAFVTTGGNKSGPNLTPIHFATEEGNYLQGMEAGFLSKTGKGGFVGGEQNAPVQLAAEAFQKGAVAANPSFKYQITYIASWDDPAKAKTQTITLLNNGCDVISHNCDAAAKGMFDTAGIKPGVYTFGVNADQNNLAPNVFSSAVLDIPKAFADIAAQVKAKTFKGGPVSLGMKDGDVTLVDNPKFASVLTADQKAKIKAAEDDIVAGKIKLWNH